MSKFYEIRLTPIDKFFFGGESYFDDKDGVFYFQHSRRFPQQTTLLGMLRFQLLRNNGLFEDRDGKLTIVDTQRAEQVIGPESFNGRNDGFGQVKRISPVFILEKDKHDPLYAISQLEQETGGSAAPVFTMSKGKTSLKQGIEQDSIPFVSNYSSKKGFRDVLVNKDRSYVKPLDLVYDDREAPQIGIYKNYRNQSKNDEEGFFKMQYQRFRPGYAFGCYIELGDDVVLTNEVITMGKERTSFSMAIRPLQQSPFEAPSITAGDQVLLISDAWLSPQYFQYCQAVIGEAIPFRNLHYSLKKDNNNYADKPHFGLTNRVNLLQRGALLYVKDTATAASELQKALAYNPAYRMIGYNHYLILK